MKFKIDENLPAELCVDLRSAGHDADTVSDEGLAGVDDSALMARVQAESRTLLTLDKGIADVRNYPPDKYAGIVLFRPRSTGRDATSRSSDSTCRRFYCQIWAAVCSWFPKMVFGSADRRSIHPPVAASFCTASHIARCGPSAISFNPSRIARNFAASSGSFSTRRK
jgi:hypothetical protein